MSRQWLLVTCLTTCLLGTSYAAPDAGGASAYAELIENSDLVIHGIVRGVSRDEVPVQNFMPADPRPDVSMNVIILDLDVREVLKGYHSEPQLIVVIPQGISSIRTNYNVGEEVVLSTIYWKFMRGGSFMVTNDGGSFVKRGDKWECLLVTRPSEAVEVPLAEIKEVAASFSPKRLLGSAAVVVVGKIEEVSSRRQPSGALVEDIRARLTQVIKGASNGDVITFRAVRKGGDDLAWKTIVPRFNVGDEWLLYLGRDGLGYYVLDGTNGLFRVEGDALIQGDRVRIPSTKSAFIATMAEASERE